MKFDSSVNDRNVHSRSKLLQESQRLCSRHVVKLREASQMFMMVDYVRRMTVKKS